MSSFHDPILGEVLIRRTARATALRISYQTNGKLVVSAPKLTPLFFIKSTVAKARDELQEMVENQRTPDYQDRQAIGKNHEIRVVPSNLHVAPSIKISRKKILVLLPSNSTLFEGPVQQLLRTEITKILRKEAKNYLPERLRELASRGDFHYETVRFSHANGRWGSCSSTGTISLNIALMKLPDVLIDYVLIHELCHTIHMNHSRDFWALVNEYDPLYKLHRQQLKRETPHI